MRSDPEKGEDMKNLIAVLTLLTLSQAQAQGVQSYGEQDAYAEPQMVPVMAPTQAQAAPKKRTVIYDERTNELVEVQPEVVEAQPLNIQQNTQQSVQQPVLVQQSFGAYPPARPAIQEQPVAVIQDSPLTVSSAEQRRKQRQDLEVKTEQKIVEKLEEARMEDEKARADRLFGNGFGSGPQEQVQSQTPYQPVQVVPQPVQQVVVPAVVAQPVDKEEKEEKVDIKAEIRSALAESTKKPEDTSKYYISGLVGMGKYPDVVNIRGNLSTGVTAGVVTAERLVVEASFLYGNYDVEDVGYSTNYSSPYASPYSYGYGSPLIYSMRQYNLGGALKYQLLPGKLRPTVGGVMSYTRRSLSLDYYNNYDWRTSDALDVGFVAGLDLAVNDSFAVGLDFRYLTNVAYREKTDYPQSFVYPRYDNPIEELDYYVTTLSGKFTF